MTTAKRNEADAFTVKKIEDAYKKLQEHPECKSLLKKYLTQDVVDKLKYKKTQLGATLYDVIRSGFSISFSYSNELHFLGVYNLDAGIGVYAADAECYKTFAALFDPIIQDYHGFGPNDRQPPVDLGDKHLNEFPTLDPKGKYIKSTRYWLFPTCL